MKSKIVFTSIITISILALIITGIALLQNDKNPWTKGIYFREQFGYSVFIDETPTIEIYYFNVLTAEDPLKNRSVVLFTNQQEPLSTTLIDSEVIRENKYFVEHKLVVQIDMVNQVKTIESIRFYQGSNYEDYPIGNYTVQQVERTAEIPRHLELSYGMSMVDGYDLSIKNISNETQSVTIISNHELYTPKQTTININADDTVLTTISLTQYADNPYAIYHLRPLITFKSISNEIVYQNTVIVPGIEMSVMNIKDVLTFVNQKIEVNHDKN